ncbi:hypothetical protein DVH24_010046 [Malus domestica]|uniref:Uncharacterized protein n=1 Tax=Malus domestica TaxID=3750 RepID=A0A498JWZ5_MALDO|nr:hypothetical protein DVH24_010046 [Malus domestica]
MEEDGEKGGGGLVSVEEAGLILSIPLIKICVWWGCMNALPTRANLQKRMVITTDTLVLCASARETVEHSLLD